MNATPFNHRVNLDPDINAINAKRIFLFADARSGSTWLINTLNSHPEISMVDEILNPDFEKNFQVSRQNNQTANLKGNARFVESYLGHLPEKYAGCKILFPQAIRHLDFYEFLLNYRDSRFILLYRENLVKAEISGLIANKYARWHLIEQKEKQTITVDPAFLFDRLIWRRSTREFCMKLINAYCPNVITIEYESLFSESSENLKKISEFLAVSEKEFRLGTEVKSNPFSLNELIENFNECRKAFTTEKELFAMFGE